MIQNNLYFVDQINSSKANKFTEVYHYSGTGFKKAVVNLGIFRNSDKLLVGVLQWGCSYQNDIRLDRYVKDNISKNEYLELNRFSMADSEGKNSESQGISLGIKWIKQNMPEVRLLVSYSGRKEGNYGYIYQATNWEYLGYFISPGFWLVDGEERHQVTLWYRHSKHHPELPFKKDLETMYEDIRQTWTKQFIYVMRLDKTLTLASPVLPYPKPSNEYPIMVREEIYKQNDEVFNSYQLTRREPVFYYYEKDKLLFTRQTLQRRGELPPPSPHKMYAQYDVYGHLEKTGKSQSEFLTSDIRPTQLAVAFKVDRVYKNKFFRAYEMDEEIPEEIDVPIIAIVDEIPLPRIQDVADYLNVSKQAVSQARLRKKDKIRNIPVIWVNEENI